MTMAMSLARMNELMILNNIGRLLRYLAPLR